MMGLDGTLSLDPPLEGGSETHLRFRGGVTATRSGNGHRGTESGPGVQTPPQNRFAVLTLPQGEGSRETAILIDERRPHAHLAS